MRRTVLLSVLLASAHAVAAPRGWEATSDRAWWTGRADAPGAVGDAGLAERAARRYLDAHLAELAPGAAASDFTLLANHLDSRGLRTVTFAQHWRGMPVVDGAVGFVFGHDRLFAVRARAQPDVTARLPRSSSGRERHVLRVDRGYRVVEITEEPGARVYRDAITGAELARRSTIMTATGTLAFDAGARHGGAARTGFPASHASVLVNSANATTASDGTFTWTGSAPATVIAGVSGPYVRVINTLGPSVTQTFTVAPGATAVWDASAVETDDAQLSAFVYANIAKARARIINPAAGAWLDAQMDVTVNAPGSCNAASNGDAVTFVRSNAQCANSALVGDVVFHEVGHSIHNQSIIAGMGAFDGHLSEGLADFFAANITGDPAMGRGFFKTEEPLRHIDPPGIERVYPLDFDFDTHISGLIIAGALWDLRKTLVAQLGSAAGIAQTEAVLAGIMQRADDISTTWTAALIADDDDSDLANGTPNFCALYSTFGRHGLVPDYATTTAAAPEITGRRIRVRVTTPASTPCPPPAVSAVRVTWKANDGVASELVLAPEGTDYTGEFPDQPDGALLTYVVDVEYADGSVTSFPQNAADPQYQLYVGDVTPIWCESFDDAPAWEETLANESPSSPRGPVWRLVPPATDPTSHDPRVAFDGTSVYGTEGGARGAYYSNLDAAITTPAIDIPTYASVRLHYRRWLTVEDGAYDTASIEANGTEVWSNSSSPSGTIDHVDREWRFHDIDLTPQITGGALQLSWKLLTDGSKELGGWAIDDVCVVGVGKLATCGDAIVDIGEQCDDGNRAADDGCDSVCFYEVTAGGGGCSTSGTPSLLVLLGVLGLAQRRRRASSFVPSRSVSAREP